MIEDLLRYNEEFVKNKGYEPYQTSKYPDRRLAIVTCMDTRLIELLPAALGIKNGSVYLLFHNEHNAVGTVTCKENEICRLFVLPEYQGRGYGSSLMRFAEETIFAVFASCRLDASLPAKAIYRKRGYREIESHVIPTEHGDFLCYDVMEKRKA